MAAPRPKRTRVEFIAHVGQLLAYGVQLSDEGWLDQLEDVQKELEAEIDRVAEGLDEKQYAEGVRDAISRDEEQ